MYKRSVGSWNIPYETFISACCCEGDGPDDILDRSGGVVVLEGFQVLSSKIDTSPEVLESMGGPLLIHDRITHDGGKLMMTLISHGQIF